MRVVVHRLGTGYEALSSDLPGCRGRGRTPEQATRSLELAAQRMIEAYAKAGRLVPWTPPGRAKPPLA